MPPVHLIDGEEALAAFRSNWFSVRALAPVIDEQRVTLVNVPIGIGKSTLLDALLDHYRAAGTYDLLVVLAALTAGVLERRLVRNPAPGVIRLRPRPRDDCGPLDQPWRAHEANGTTTWAKQNVCPTCVHHASCPWPRQYGSSLKGARIVFGTHRHLVINRRFVHHLRCMTRAKTVLLLVDESDFLAESFRIKIPPPVLREFLEAVRHAHLPEATRRAWIEPARLLLGAKTEDLRAPGWSFPRPTRADTLAIQEAGLAQNPQFRWCGYDLHAFSRARRAGRWRDRDGSILFIQAPVLGDHTVFFAAGLSADFLTRQLRIERVAEPYQSVRCQHRATRCYNLRSWLGAACRFGSNHRQILDFFGQLILRNVAAGRRTLLVARKHLKPLCKTYLEHRLERWGCRISVVLSSGEPVQPSDPATLALIHYGISGVNTFELYDAVYCLSSYYSDESVLREAVADCEADDLRFPMALRPAEPGGIRLARTFNPRYRYSNADRILRAYHRQFEANTVIQTIGRVRFATRPREVIAFQCSELPGIVFTAEFRNLQQARDHFGLLPGSEFDRRRQEADALRLKAEGRTVRQIAERLGVSERTAFYRLRAARGQEDEA